MTWVSLLLALIVVTGVGIVFRRSLAARPELFAHAFWAYSRALGVIGAVRNVRGIDPSGRHDFFARLRSVDLESCKRFRDAFVALDTLPTIASGNRTLGYRWLLEAQVRRDFSRRESPYTHPLQVPYVFLSGVPARTFYDRREFPWVQPLEEAYPVVREELLSVLQAGGAGFKKYRMEGGAVSETWNTFNLFIQGEKVEENALRVPRTVALLESLPRFERHHIVFSALNPNSGIAPHVGPMNGVLRAHLPLLVPPGCGIRVGPDERTWEEGKVLVFDDSFIHEVWNRSGALRIVLFMNFWHPCFADAEVAILERFRATVDRVSAMSAAWKRYQEEPRPHTIAFDGKRAAL